MKKVILICIAALLILLVAVVRYIFHQKIEIFEKSIRNYETEQLQEFRTEKEHRITLLAAKDPVILKQFTQEFDESKSFSDQDTVFSYLYLSENIKYKVASVKYIDCLNYKCLIDEHNKLNQKLIANKEAELKKEYGETFSIWYSKLKDEKLLKTNKPGDCNSYFPDLSEISFDTKAWNDFEKLMIAYNSEMREAQNQNKQTENQYNNSIANIRRQLKSSVIDYFNNELSTRKSQILTSETETKVFNSTVLGSISYNIDKRSFSKDALQNVADDAFEEQWKTNSLYTGAMPYASCYGSSNYCDSYGCSKITVLTGSTDVLVTIKDMSGEVVRHGYINSGSSFSFNLPDGTYQVFFYSGSGWNPNKVMTSSTCGTLHGGFIFNEDVSKVESHDLYNKEWTIELILQQDGNLHEQPSSKSEAF